MYEKVQAGVRFGVSRSSSANSRCNLKVIG